MEVSTAVEPVRENIELPIPSGYHLLVKLVTTAAKIGSIHIPQARKVDEDTASMMAIVLGMGPDAYLNPDKFPTGPWCAVGDTILMKSLAGHRVMVGQGNDKEEYRLIHDDTVIATISDPSVIGRAF